MAKNFKYTPKFTKADVAKRFADGQANMKRTIIERLTLIGWEFVKMARAKTDKQGGFGDVTGNLRSSIGFVVLDQGSIIYGDFELAKKGTDREAGLRKAKQYTKTLASRFGNGYALIVVAGMEYAAAVENRSPNKDVITGSSLIAEAMLKDAMKNMKKRAGI